MPHAVRMIACVNAPVLQVDDDYYEDLDYEPLVRDTYGEALPDLAWLHSRSLPAREARLATGT